MLTELEPTRDARASPSSTSTGYPCYTTSAGWLGY